MPVTICQPGSDDSIPMQKLRKGQIARIVKFGDTPAEPSIYRGIFIQGCHNGDIQETGGGCWWREVPQGDEYRVRVVPDGTLLQVNQNKGIK